MSQNQKQAATVQLTKSALESAKSTGEMLEIPAIQARWVETQQKLFKMPAAEAETRFETEKILFMQKVTENKQLSNCDRFSSYSAFMQLCASNLTLREGLSYLIPYKGKMTFRVGWKGRLEQILEMPGVEEVYPPQVVYSTDEFDYEKGMKGLQINRHKDVFPRPKNAEIHFVYMIIERNGRTFAYMMNRDEVINIRDRYSDSFKNYMKHLGSDNNKGKNFGDALEAVHPQYGPYTIETPMWVSDEEQAFKKTLVHRVYNELPNKLLRHYKLDTAIETASTNAGVDVQPAEDGPKWEEGDGFEYVEELVDDDAPAADESTDSEKQEKPEIVETDPKPGKQDKETEDEYDDGEAF